MPEIKTKNCTKCDEEYPITLEHFPPDQRSHDGLQGQCRACKKISDRKSYFKHRELRCIRQRRYNASKKGKIIRRKYRNSTIGLLRRVFHNMKYRCDNPEHVSYKNYGGRGIKCFFKSADEFIDYAINKLQIDPHGLQIDRIDNNGNYERGNIRFVTRSENNLNRRDNKNG